jgi:hypothetical protein
MVDLPVRQYTIAYVTLLLLQCGQRLIKMRSVYQEREDSNNLDLELVYTTEFLEVTFRHSTC